MRRANIDQVKHQLRFSPDDAGTELLRRASAPVASVLVAALLLLGRPGPAMAQQQCDRPGAEFFAVVGIVEVMRRGTSAWVVVADGDLLCPGDSAQLGEYSSAGLMLPDETEMRFSELAVVRWEVTEDEERTIWRLIRGLFYGITRQPNELNFSTAVVNAGIEGTEFMIDVSESATEVTVIEGRVVLETEFGDVNVNAGELAVTRPGVRTTVDRAADFRELLAWTLYFASLESNLPGPDAEPSLAQSTDAAFFAGRAAQRLRRGSVDAARTDLLAALALDPAQPLAVAVDALISARLDQGGAIGLEPGRVTQSGDIPVMIVQALTQRGEADVESARAGLESAVALEPDNALAWARLGEMQLATDRTEAALESARRALELEPNLAHAHSVIGFAEFRRFAFSDAAASFRQAIGLDGSDPLPHLGLGLALIGAGDRYGGRRQIERAVALNPDDPQLRSYMAKAYSDEGRDELALTQLLIAEQFDAEEPTVPQYEAFVQQSRNAPVAALRSLERAVALNDSRMPYRSRLLLDEDLAIQSAARGQIFGDLGFERLALRAAYESVLWSPQEFGGYRLLADAYASVPRHQIARINSLFRSQLIQTYSVTPIPPQLAEPGMFIQDTVGPSNLTYSDYGSFLLGNDWRIEGAAVTGSNATRGAYATISGTHNRLSYSLGQYRHETDGFRENNDAQVDVGNIFVQFRASERTSWLAELRATRNERGDVERLFDPAWYVADLRQRDDVDVVRFGVRHELTERLDLLAAVHYQEVESPVLLGSVFAGNARGDSHAVDIQSIFDAGRLQLISGVNLIRDDRTESITLRGALPFPPFDIVETSTRARIETDFYSAYTYSNLELTDAAMLTLGASYDRLNDRGDTVSKLNPKLALSWALRGDLTFRAAAFRTLQGPLVSKQNILPRLEPTEVAGFNQFFFGTAGDVATRLGVGMDRRLSASLYYGAELSRREISRDIFVLDPAAPASQPLVVPVDLDETSGRVYAYWTPLDTMAVSVELVGDLFDNNGKILDENYARLETHRLPVSVRYFHPSGISSGVTLSYVEQSGRFGREFLGGGDLANDIVSDQDSFSVVDLSLEYRLGQRRGMVGLYLRNLFDEEFKFQDTDPENPRIMPERHVSLRLELAF